VGVSRAAARLIGSLPRPRACQKAASVHPACANRVTAVPRRSLKVTPTTPALRQPWRHDVRKPSDVHGFLSVDVRIIGPCFVFVISSRAAFKGAPTGMDARAPVLTGAIGDACHRKRTKVGGGGRPAAGRSSVGAAAPGRALLVAFGGGSPILLQGQTERPGRGLRAALRLLVSRRRRTLARWLLGCLGTLGRQIKSTPCLSVIFPVIFSLDFVGRLCDYPSRERQLHNGPRGRPEHSDEDRRAYP
jgi:hypothetical protein